MAKKGKIRKQNAWVIGLLALLFAAGIGFLAWTQLKNYEEGIMEVYATQQDGYVQLVLDQINLNKERSNDEIITDILGTLDASSNKYWTLSQKDALVFVKDVMETNRYKGFTTATYYVSDSAREFISALQTDRVLHRIIDIGERRYVASGVQFTYRGDHFRICLLTSSGVVLDQNAYLSARINLASLAVIELAVFVMGITALAIVGRNWQKKYETVAGQTEGLQKTIERLNAVLEEKTLYDTRSMAFGKEATPELFEQLIQRQNAWPINFLLLSCGDIETRDRFLRESQVALDRLVLRIVPDATHVVLISLQDRGQAEKTLLDVLRQPGVRLVGNMTLRTPPASVEEFEKIYKEFRQERVMMYGE